MAETPEKKPRKKPLSLYLLTVEWSDSPYHEGTKEIFLSYSADQKRWSIITPFEKRFATITGEPEDDKRTVAIKLLKRAWESHRLRFDNIINPGPYHLKPSDFLEPQTRYHLTSEPIDPPSKTCRYCRHLCHPQGVFAGMARQYSCSKNQWDDSVRRPLGGGAYNPNLDHSCGRFEPEFKRVEYTVYG